MEILSLTGLKKLNQACLGISTSRGWLVVKQNSYYYTSDIGGATRFHLWNDIGRELNRLGLYNLKYQVLPVEAAD
ncbi:hypothetical protein [Pedosphaera parvula]|nr:hypothetical protein [Pedosphaera parvula]